MTYFPFIRIILLDFSLTSCSEPFLTHNIKEPCTCHRCKLIATPPQEHTRRSFQMPASRMAHRSSRSFFFLQPKFKQLIRKTSASFETESELPRCRVLSTMRSVFQPPKGEPKSKSTAGLSTCRSLARAK